MADSIRLALVDDDEAVLHSLGRYFLAKGLAATGFSSAEALLAALERAEAFDCIVADVRMPGLSGMELLAKLAKAERRIPMILITGHGDIDLAVAAIKRGAHDFIEKPFDAARLLTSIQTTLAQLADQHPDSPDVGPLRERYNLLSERQRQVMELVALGLSNKEISIRLNLSVRTVENHRAWLMERMGARNLAELVRMAMKLN